MKDNSGLAFPFIENDQLGQSVNTGMTKRELIAMNTLQGLIAKYSLNAPDDKKIVCQMAVQLADSLLAELEKS